MNLDAPGLIELFSCRMKRSFYAVLEGIAPHAGSAISAGCTMREGIYVDAVGEGRQVASTSVSEMLTLLASEGGKL